MVVWEEDIYLVTVVIFVTIYAPVIDPNTTWEKVEAKISDWIVVSLETL